MYYNSKGYFSEEMQKSKNIKTLFPTDFSEEEIAILRELARERLAPLQPESDSECTADSEDNNS